MAVPYRIKPRIPLELIQKFRGVYWFNNNWTPEGMITTSLSGSASFDWRTDYLWARTGDAAGSYASFYKAAVGLTGAASWDKRRFLGLRVKLDYASVQIIHLVTGGVATPSDTVNLLEHVGFMISYADLYGHVANGTRESRLLLERLTGSPTRTLELDFKPGAECRFYVDKVDKGAITTNLPSGIDYAPYVLMGSIYNTLAANRTLYLYEFRIYQEE